MVCRVFIWKNDKGTGHASILIRTAKRDPINNNIQEDGCYVTFGPTGASNLLIAFFKTYDSHSSSITDSGLADIEKAYADDVHYYRQPIHIIENEKLDDEAMLHYIRHKLKPDSQNYNLLSKNCSTVVSNILFVGLNDYYLDENAYANLTHLVQKAVRSIKHQVDFDWDGQRHVENIKKVAESAAAAFGNVIRASIRSGRVHPAAVASGLALDFFVLLPAWTPGDVYYLVSELPDSKIVP